MKKLKRKLALIAAILFFACSIFVWSTLPAAAVPSDVNEEISQDIEMEPDGLPEGPFELVTLDDVAEDQPIGNIPGRKRLSKAGTAGKTMPLLVIVVGLKDTPYNDSYDWSRTVFSADDSEWSLSKYYTDNSQGQFTFAPARETSEYGQGGNTNTKDAVDDGIVHVSVNRNHGNWVSQWKNNDLSDENLVTWRDTLEEVMASVDDYVDFSIYDANNNGEIDTNEMAVSFVVAGGEASNSSNRDNTSPNYLTWAHAWRMSAFMDAAPACDGKRVDRYITLGEDLRYYRYPIQTEGMDKYFDEEYFEPYSDDWASQAREIVSDGRNYSVDQADVFAFRPAKSGKYTFSSEDPEYKTDPGCRVIDSEGTMIACASRRNGYGQDREQFCISFDAEAGKTYYLQTMIYRDSESSTYSVNLIEGVPEEYLETQIAGVFTLAHELGHYLGLPDFYNTRDKTGAWNNYGVGRISVMANGNWCYVNVPGEGSVIRPCALDACSRVALKWIEPVTAVPGNTYAVTAQNYENNSGYNVLKIPTDNEGEYYLVENRQFSGWDEGLATSYPAEDGYTMLGVRYTGSYTENGGLVFWHVDEGIIEQYEPDNEINTADHRPGYMPVYMEHDGDKNFKFTGSKVEKNNLFFDEEIYRDHYASAGETIFLPTYSTTEDVPSARTQSDHDRGITLQGTGASINLTLTNAHTLTKTAAAEATCTRAGNSAYWTCSKCGKYFSDAQGRNEIAKNSWVIQAGHKYGAWKTTKEPTYTAAGSREKVCSKCGNKVTESIPKLKRTGWHKIDGEWYYFKSDGQKATDAWAKDSKGWCWMDASGKITKSKWIKSGGEWYYLKSNGYMAAKEWAKDSGGWYWMNASGKIAKNVWAKDSGGWYWMNGSGRIAKNAWAKDSKGWCWMGSNGRITKSKWVKYRSDWYYLNSSGYMVTGIQKINGKTYKFDKNGKWIS